MDTEPPHFARCPECGRDAHSPAPSPRPRRAILAWQLGLLLAAIAWIVWTNWRSWPVLPAPRVSGRDVVTSTDFPATRFTAADVKLVAEGALHADLVAGLADSWRFTPEAAHVEIAAGFGPSTGDVTDFRRIGWPIPWINHRYDTSYADIYARAGAMPRPWRYPVGWSGWLPRRSHFTHGIDQGRRHIRTISPEALVGVVVLLIAGFECGRAAGRLMGRFCRRPPRALRLLPLAGAAFALVPVVMLSGGPERTSMRLPQPWMPPTQRTGIRVAEVRTQEDQARLARAILKATEGRQNGVLILGTYLDFAMAQSHASGGWPDVGATRLGYPGDPPPPRLRFTLEPHWAALRVRSPAPQGYTFTTYSVSLIPVCELAIGLYALWRVPRIARRLAAAYSRRRTRLRARRGLCIHCGYDLT